MPLTEQSLRVTLYTYPLCGSSALACPHSRVRVPFPDLFALAVHLFIQIPTCGDLVVAFSDLEVSSGLPIEYLLLYVETLTPLARAMRENYHISDYSNTLQRLLGIQSLTTTVQNASLRKYTLSAVARFLLLNPRDPSFRLDFASSPIATAATIRACRYPKTKRHATPILITPHNQPQSPLETPPLTIAVEVDIGTPFPGEFPSMKDL